MNCLGVRDVVITNGSLGNMRMRNSCPRYASGVGTDEKYYKKTTAPSHARKRPRSKEGRKGACRKGDAFFWHITHNFSRCDVNGFSGISHFLGTAHERGRREGPFLSLGHAPPNRTKPIASREIPAPLHFTLSRHYYALMRGRGGGGGRGKNKDIRRLNGLVQVGTGGPNLYSSFT